MLRMDPKYFGPDKEPLAGAKSPPKATSSLYYACGVCYLAALSFGYMIGYSSPALPQMTEKDGPLDEDTATWFGSVVTIGGMVGCLLAGWIVEKIGRKGSLLSNVLPYILGWGLIVFSSDVTMLCLGRFFTGIASGMVTVTCPLYISEISTKELRGMLGSGVQLSITVGIMAVYLLGMLVSWRVLAFIGLIIPIAATVGTVGVPDTPRYLLARGLKQEALRALIWLRGPLSDAEEELRDMEESVDVDAEKMSLKEFCKPELFTPLRVAVGLMLFQQLSGINVVMFYTVSIFQSAGFKEGGGQATVLIGAVQVVGTLVACGLMDRAGRRLLLFVGGFGMGVTCFTMGLYYHITSGATGTGAPDLSWLAVTSLVIYTIAFSIGWGPIPMLVMSEIFPVKARGTASGIATVVNWTCAFILTKEFSEMQSMIGQDGAFWFFSACCFTGVVFVWKFVPETKGKSLEDIELYFLGRAVRGI